MADDLSAFFAKRTSKSKKKAIRVEEVAQQLEQNARFDRDVIDEDVVQKLSENQTSNKLIAEEDSDWILPGSKPELHLNGETVKTFNYIEQEEEPIPDPAERENLNQERTRTWNLPKAKDDEEKTEIIVPTITTKQAQYCPPSARRQMNARKNQVDINNEELFPSIEAADKIEKQQTEDTRRQRDEQVRAAAAASAQAQLLSERRAAAAAAAAEAVRPTPNPPAPRLVNQPPDVVLNPGEEMIMNAKGEWTTVKKEKTPASSFTRGGFTRSEASGAKPADTYKPPSASSTATTTSERVAPPQRPIQESLPELGPGEERVQNAKGEWRIIRTTRDTPKPEPSKPTMWARGNVVTRQVAPPANNPPPAPAAAAPPKAWRRGEALQSRQTQQPTANTRNPPAPAAQPADDFKDLGEGWQIKK